MPERDDRLHKVAAARAGFLESGRRAAGEVPDLVVASWVRSRRAGVDAERALPDPAGDIDTGSRLVRCARPVLDQLGADTADLPLVIALTDARARVLQRLDSSTAVGRMLDRVNLAPGFTYAETAVGTNGVGTALEAGRAVSVVGPEHFTEHLQVFACTGAPIIDPLTGRLEGILDITTRARAWSPLMHSLVKSAATDIGRNLLADHSQAQQALFDTYLRTDARSAGQPVFAFADSVVMANAVAQAAFDPAEQRAIRQYVDFLATRRDRVADTVTLASGRVVRLSGTRIVSGDRTAGMVVVAYVVDDAARRDGAIADEVLPCAALPGPATRVLAEDLHRPHAPIASGASPAWRRACDELRAALAEGAPTIVVGETGTGKFSLVAELFHEAHPAGRSVSVDAVQPGVVADVTDLDHLLRRATEPTLCIVRNVDQAGTEAVERLDAVFDALRASPAPVTFVATLSDTSLDSDLPFHALLGHFEVAVTVPPLRQRTGDLCPIVERLLAEIAPGHRVSLTEEAMGTVARYSWPRNVSQLREALVSAVRRRPVGRIRTEDLPSYCRTRSRARLTRIEAAEVDAILEALARHDGNRVAAARYLGISRSSLYRKLHVYGITA